jgi:hypothetical protein
MMAAFLLGSVFMRVVRLAVLGLFFFLAFHIGMHAQQPPQPKDAAVMDRTDSLGPFLLEGRSFTVTLQWRAFTDAEMALDSDCGKGTVDSMEIRNGSGAVVAARSFGFRPPSDNHCESRNVSAALLKGSSHTGLLILYNDTSWPAAPTTYTDTRFQLFGVVNGQLRSFHHEMLVNYFLNHDEVFDVRQELRRIAPLDAFSDVWTLPVWAEHFNVLYPIRIDWSVGKLEPLKECSRLSPRAFCPYAVEPITSFERGPELTGILHLCASRTEPCLDGEELKVAQERQITMQSGFANILWDHERLPGEWQLGASNNEGEDQVWLKLQVNGSEGWIHHANDYRELGFPEEQ